MASKQLSRLLRQKGNTQRVGWLLACFFWGAHGVAAGEDGQREVESILNSCEKSTFSAAAVRFEGTSDLVFYFDNNLFERVISVPLARVSLKGSTLHFVCMKPACISVLLHYHNPSMKRESTRLSDFLFTDCYKDPFADRARDLLSNLIGGSSD